MRSLRIVSAAAVLSLASISFGLVQMFVQSDGHPNPTYWSGTSCRARISCQVLPEGMMYSPTIDEIQIWIKGFSGGTLTEANLIHHWTRSGLQPYSFGTGFQLMFDSTHFENGSTVKVVLRVKEYTGATYEGQVVATVYNKYAIFEHEEWASDPETSSWENVKAALDSVNYVSAGIGGGGTWGYPEFQLSYLASTFFYENSHGAYVGPMGQYPGYGQFEESGLYGGTIDALERFANQPILPLTQSAVGSGSPPFQTGRPTTWIAIFDSCDSAAALPGGGNDSSFAEAALWPYQNAYGGLTENQAVFGWSGLCGAETAQDVYEVVMDKLNQGLTVDQARNLAGNAQLIVNGDHHARLTKVYTGTTSMAPDFWWRYE